MTISTFLQNPKNSVTREMMFLDRIKYDLKLAAALARVPLQIFTPDVDRDGYDIIVDDADLVRRFQLKTVLKSSNTTSWKVHKRLLRPTMYSANLLHFEVSPEGVGIEGGVILIQIDDSEDACPATYYYTDIYVLTALAVGLILTNRNSRARQAVKFLNRLRRGIGTERVAVPLGAFVKLRAPSCLLAIGGFHSSEPAYSWWTNLIIAFRDNFRIDKTPLLDDAAARGVTALARNAIDSLLSLIDEPGLRAFTVKRFPWAAPS